MEGRNNWESDTDNYDEQEQQPQMNQQPPQQYQQQPPPPQHIPPEEKKKKPLMIAIFAVIAVVAIIVIWLLFSGTTAFGGSLVGRWEADHAEWTYEWDGETYSETEDMDGWVEFNRDGTGRSDFGDGTEDFEWEDIGGGKLRITSEDSTDEVNYSISGNTLTISEEDSEGSYRMIFKKA